MPINTLRQIPLNEMGGVTGASLKRRGLDDLRNLVEGRGQQIGRAITPIGRGALTPEREQQLTRQAAGTQLTPSELKPQQPGVGEVAREGIQQVREQVEPQRIPKRLPTAPPALPQQPGSKGEELLKKMVTEGSKLFTEPIRARISQSFGVVNRSLYQGVTKGARHVGVDIAVPKGTPLQLPVSGKVVVGNSPGGYGAYVKVLGDDGTEFRFSHLSEVAPNIVEAAQRGARVPEGTIFGKTGGVPGERGAGLTTGAHLDITAKQGGKFVDPMKIESVRKALS